MYSVVWDSAQYTWLQSINLWKSYHFQSTSRKSDANSPSSDRFKLSYFLFIKENGFRPIHPDFWSSTLCLWSHSINLQKSYHFQSTSRKSEENSLNSDIFRLSNFLFFYKTFFFRRIHPYFGAAALCSWSYSNNLSKCDLLPLKMKQFG